MIRVFELHVHTIFVEHTQKLNVCVLFIEIIYRLCHKENLNKFV